MRDGDRLDVQDVEDVEDAGTTTESVGEQLRTARVRAGLTLEQVSATTRIRVPVLRDLEEDRLGPAGSAVYTRGHLRAIAHTVGIDPAPLVRALDARVGASAPSVVRVPEPVPAPRAPTGGLSVPRPAPPERDSPRWLTACLVGVAVLVVLLALGTLTGGAQDPERRRALATPEPLTSAAAPQSAVAPRPAAGAALVLRAQGSSWLSVRNRGDARLFQGTVEAGWTRRFDDPVALTVRVGNGGALQVSCAGAPGTVQGGEGVALTLRCTPEGLQRR